MWTHSSLTYYRAPHSGCPYLCHTTDDRVTWLSSPWPWDLCYGCYMLCLYTTEEGAIHCHCYDSLYNYHHMYMLYYAINSGSNVCFFFLFWEASISFYNTDILYLMSPNIQGRHSISQSTECCHTFDRQWKGELYLFILYPTSI